MPMLNFQKQFVDPIRRGVKAHTIRADRAIPIKPGDSLYLYCGARTKACFRILEQPVTCTRTQRIAIPSARRIIVDGEPLDIGEMNSLAEADGFATLNAMMAFWEGRLPFRGQIIHWPLVVTFNEFS